MVAALLLSLLSAFPALATAPSSGFDREGEEALRRRITPEVEVAREAGPAVVFITNRSVKLVRDWFRVFEAPQEGTGSGVVLGKDGLIITNYHVVQAADHSRQQLIVRFDPRYDPHEYEAELVSFVRQEDLALIRIKGDKDFPTIPLGQSSDLMLGEKVIAIGNPVGQTHTITSGIISGLHRNLEIPQNGLRFANLIQTDAPINPGNSGGPLLNVNSELIGITTAMNSIAQNIAFAIPVDRIREVLDQRLLAPDAASAWMGFDVGGGENVVVSSLISGSPAALAGVRLGDCILAVDARPITGREDFRLARIGLKPDRQVKLSVENEGRRRELSLQPWDKHDGALYAHVGLKVATRETQNGSYVEVIEVRSDGPAAKLGLSVGDILEAVRPVRDGIQRRPWRVYSREMLAAFVAEASEPDAKLQFDVYRDVDKNGAFERSELHRGTLTLQ